MYFAVDLIIELTLGWDLIVKTREVWGNYDDIYLLGMESDDEIRRVPDMGGEAAGASVAHPDRVQGTTQGTRRKGKSPADKENKRLKR